MQELFSDPRTYLAVIAIGGLIFAVGRWVGAVNSDRETFKAFMDEVRGDIKEILRRLPAKAAGSESPLRLTDVGRRVSKEIGAATLARKLALELLPQAQGKRPHQIYRLCTDYVDNVFTPTPEQQDLFDAAAYEEAIGASEVRLVIVIELRDYLLERVSSAPQTETPEA